MQLKEIIENLKNLKPDQLIQLQAETHQEFLRRKPEHSFQFEETADPRKGHPYVAKLTLNNEGKFDREFKDLERTYGKKEVTVSGTYTAKTGEILEIQTGGSWKNTYREFYIVDENGQLGSIGHHTSSRTKNQIKKYLRDEIKYDEFFIN